MAKSSICVLPRLKGIGGPASFQAKLRKGLLELGINTHHNIHDPSTKALLVVGGTRRFNDLIFARRNKIRIVQRLDGMNWLHRKHTTGLRHFLRSERNNFQLSLTRNVFADAIAYQSFFTQNWWNGKYGKLDKPQMVIHNAVDLQSFSPGTSSYQKDSEIRILVVEGSFKGGHERDLANAVDIANGIAEKVQRSVQLLVAGSVPNAFKPVLVVHENVSIEWLGLIDHKDIPELDRSAHLFFPAEINAACPNSLIEAMACGVPIIGYATGSIPELVGEDGGRIAPYGGDYWNLGEPHRAPLVNAALDILSNHHSYQVSARKRAEERFGLGKMVEKYCEILLDKLPRV